MNARTAILAVVFGAGATGANAQFTGPYELQNWSSTGITGGSTSITPMTGPSVTADFGYDVDLGNPGPGVTFRTAEFKTRAAGTGTVSFDWDYNGIHAWFLAEAVFQLFADSPGGRQVIDVQPLTSTSGNFSFFGSASIQVEQGFDFGFIIGGSNFDSTSMLRGTLTISSFDAPLGCYPDCDGNTVLDVFDFLCFQDAFVAGAPYADCDGNTVLDVFDFLCFQDAFVVGCP
jgi:hypothetical protein